MMKRLSLRCRPCKLLNSLSDNSLRVSIAIILCIGALFSSPDVEGRKTGYRTSAYERIKTRQSKVSDSSKGSKEKTKKTVTAETDSTLFYSVAPLVVMKDYDKRASSTRESFIISNGSELLLTEIQLEITYLTDTGEELHLREIVLPCYIPPGRNRKFDISSWDPQHSYRYYKSTPPRKSRASLPSIPYRISSRIVSFTTK